MELYEKECQSYSEVINQIEEILEENGYNPQDYLLESIIEECYESDGKTYTIIVDEDELLESINNNQL